MFWLQEAAHKTAEHAEQAEEHASPIIVQIGLLQRQCELAGRARDLLLPRLMDGEILP